MHSDLLLLKQNVQSLLKEYRSFVFGLSADNPFSKFSFADKQPKFRGQTRAYNLLFNMINPNELSFEDFQLYQEVDGLLDELNDEVF